MNELKKMLINVDHSYYDFVTFVLHYVKDISSRLETVRFFTNNNLEASSTDLLYFISTQMIDREQRLIKTNTYRSSLLKGKIVAFVVYTGHA